MTARHVPAVAALLALLAAPAYAHKAESLKLAATDRDGAVLLDSARLPNSYHLYVARVAPDGSISGFWQVYVAASFRLTPEGIIPSGEKKLSALRLKPGRYIFTRILQNLHWQACFWSGTLTFDVEPGVATYIGEVDPKPVLDDLVAQATAEGLTKVMLASVVHRFKDGFSPLRAGAPTEIRSIELDEKRTKLFKALTAPIRSQTATPFRFASYDASGRLCK